MSSPSSLVTPIPRLTPGNPAYPILLTLGVCHLLNDMMQSLLPSLYPLLQQNFSLSFAQVGLITLTFQITASLLQPLVGLYTDRHPLPYSLPIGMAFTLGGLLLLANAPNFSMVLIAAAMVGSGSSVFHPESSRVARLASGGRHGLAQSIFQVGGNVGTAIGPLLAAFIVMPKGQAAVAWFALAAMLAILLLGRISAWYRHHLVTHRNDRPSTSSKLPQKTILISLFILGVLIFSKYFYLASLSSYYTFYLMDRFALSAQSAQIYLFVFLAAVAIGTIAGGPIGDRIGRRTVIWVSILGALPFTLLLPHASLFWTMILSGIIGMIMASAFPAIIVYAQELLPNRTGMVAGLFYGFAFGMGGLGAAVLGELADHIGIRAVYALCAYLPALGLFAGLLPRLHASSRLR